MRNADAAIADSSRSYDRHQRLTLGEPYSPVPWPISSVFDHRSGAMIANLRLPRDASAGGTLAANATLASAWAASALDAGPGIVR